MTANAAAAGRPRWRVRQEGALVAAAFVALSGFLAFHPHSKAQPEVVLEPFIAQPGPAQAIANEIQDETMTDLGLSSIIAPRLGSGRPSPGA